jgi:ribosomal protein S18 acetylase RimI-like enzyme
MKLSLRYARISDEEFCRDVHLRAFRDVAVRQFGENAEEVSKRAFNLGWSNILKNGKIILSSGTPCGYVESERCFISRFDHIREKVLLTLKSRKIPSWLDIKRRREYFRICNLVIAPEFQGRGIGSSILDRIIRRARARKCSVKLSVLFENRAIGLYMKKGFVVIGKEGTHLNMELRN